MTKDIPRAVRQVTKSFRDVGSEEGFQEIFRFGCEVGRVTDSSGDDLFVQSHRVRVFGKEWRVTSLSNDGELVRKVSGKKRILIDVPTFRTSTHRARTNRHSCCNLATVRSQVRDNREYL